MFTVKFFFNLVRLLNSETSANSIAAAFVLGLSMGLVPFLTVQFALMLVVTLFFRVNLTSAFIAFGIGKLLAAALAPQMDAAGSALLDASSLQGFWTAVCNAPVMPVLRLNHTLVLAGTAAAAALAIPAFVAVRILVALYRVHVQNWVNKSRIAAFLRSLWIYQLYQRVVSPLA